ncbi:interleukin-27 subunit alpha [Tiliqua scincoides]|uniref:interleukin-27 subunit alpha n=1 Tax=Tiliqua scincoides TaxID=71010 RepID=UPI0034633622
MNHDVQASHIIHRDSVPGTPADKETHGPIRAALLLQALLNFGLVIVAVSSALQEAKKPGLASDHHRRVDLQEEFRSNLKLSRQLLYKTRILTRQYLSERLPGVQLTFLSRSELLPSASLSVQNWLSLSVAERLSHMAKMLAFYQELVRQLMAHEAQKENCHFTHRFVELSVFLRDLSSHVSYQISLWGLPLEDQPEPTHSPPQILQHESAWRNRQEVYHVLRSLESVLCRIVRDFEILRVKVAKHSSHLGATKSPASHHLPF